MDLLTDKVDQVKMGLNPLPCRAYAEKATDGLTTRIMNDSSKKAELVKNLSLYKEFQAEREEILRHKWIESEKAGYDIGFDKALVDWMVNHRPAWRKSRQIVD